MWALQWSGEMAWKGNIERGVLRRIDNKGRAVVRLDAGRVIRLPAVELWDRVQAAADARKGDA